ncbi:argininosuccinate lyase [Candidatus Halobonum tyrrellensis]|uniref:Argininosuccinate lyase n=1 Tax=Candidatus Halobonum tyrrellensis G22 TaxID=1324957 RepID=V4HFX6_9EURY|nr:argininosuccinate lyase [Candidatus Halobonum tyrrellensis]ESP89610.1 argininosuccinate lyase [Candidatus Halobonum tyrrellensis G22]
MVPDDDPAAGADADADGDTVVRRDRFAGGPARSFLSSLAADERIFAADLAVDRAHVVMLDERGIVEGSDATAILDALAAVERAGHGALPDGEDVHEAIESAVVDRVGPEGGRMHTARSRNDEVATCIRYRLRGDLLDAAEATLTLRGALLDAAEADADTVMPGFTHRQFAQPTTAGHLLASYAGALERDTARLLDAYDRTNVSPLGGAAFAGTPFDVDRERTAELLGFDGVVENSMDAAASRDFLVEASAALAGVGVTLSGLATDGIEAVKDGYLALSDDYSSTSSIMPQKVNPDTLELVRAVAGDAVGGLDGLLATLKGLPRAYNRDLQRATTHAWESVDAVTEATEVAAGAVATAEWDAEACAADAAAGFSTATGVADALAMAGVPFRTAHELVASAAADADELDDPEALAASLDAAAEDVLGDSLYAYVSREDLSAALDPVGSVAARDSRGGPAPDALADSIARARTTRDDHADAVAARRSALADAADRLDRAVSDRV